MTDSSFIAMVLEAQVSRLLGKFITSRSRRILLRFSQGHGALCCGSSSCPSTYLIEHFGTRPVDHRERLQNDTHMLVFR
jgi:hypothetical protein